MRANGFSSQTGYLGKVQKEQFSKRLSTLTHIRKIAEIGFNAGHSAECFFENCHILDGFVSFDLNAAPYTKPAAEYFQSLYPNRFLFIEGNSLITVPNFAKHFPTQKFDLIYIDGSHTFEYVVGDILNGQLLSHPDTILWIDDYHLNSVNQAIQFCQATGSIQLVEVFFPQDAKNPKRTWVEAQYI